MQADELEEARALLRDGRHSDALQRINLYISQNPDDAGARFLKGVVLSESGNRREAVEVFIAMTRDFPDRPEPHNNLAVLRAMDGELEAARLALLEAIRIHPSYATAHENLGDVYAKLAAEEFSEAARLDATNTSASRKLSMVNGLSAPAPATAAATSAPASEPKTQMDNDLLAVVNGWADAWSRQDVETYLGYYAKDFTPARGAGRDEWAELRRRRLTKPAFIEIRIDDPRTRFESGVRASVQFTQYYRSDTYNDRVVKKLDLVNVNDVWKILRETTVN